MKIQDRLKWVLQVIVCPQACVLCRRWVANPDFSPLCLECLAAISPLTPPLCGVCGVSVPGSLTDDWALCSCCREASPPFSRARSWGPYGGSLRRIIHSFKFQGFQRLAAPLSTLLEECCLRHFSDMDCIVPVPLHPLRKRERGFDQTLLLARFLSRRIDVPLRQSVRRIRSTAPQFGLERAARRRNVKGAFAIRGRHSLSGKKILLLDDVMTTGATVEEICRVLGRDAEPKDLQVLTVARVPKITL